MPPILQMYVSFCPFGDKCKKGGARLGADDTEDGARWRISNHLQHSPYHNLSADEGDSAAADAQVEVEERDEAEMGNMKGKGSADGGKGYEGGKGHESGKGHEGGKGHEWGKGWRYDPYEGKGKAKGKAKGYEVVVAAPPPQPVQPRFIQSIVRCEAAMRNAARLARGAALAFEEEATTLSSELSRLQDEYTRQGN